MFYINVFFPVEFGIKLCKMFAQGYAQTIAYQYKFSRLGTEGRAKKIAKENRSASDFAQN